MEDEEIDCFGTYEDGHAECLICDESEECKKAAKFSNNKEPPKLLMRFNNKRPFYIFIRKNKIKIALLCTSVYFFSELIYIFYFSLIHLIQGNIGLCLCLYFFDFILFFLIGPISLFGSFLFNLEMKKKSRYWFLGLPFSIAILINYIIWIVQIIWTVQMILSESLYLMSILKILFSATMAPLSVLFFFSIPENQRKNVIIPVIYSMIASVFCVFYLDTLSFYIMPIIGIGILIFAFTLKNMHPPKDLEQ